MDINNNESNANIEKNVFVNSGETFDDNLKSETNDSIQKIHKELDRFNVIDRDIVCAMLLDITKLEYDSVKNACEQGRLFCELKKRLKGEFGYFCEHYTPYSLDLAEQRMQIYKRFFESSHKILTMNLTVSSLSYLSRKSVSDDIIEDVIAKIEKGKLKPKFINIKGYLEGKSYDKDSKAINLWNLTNKMAVIPELIRDHKAVLDQTLAEAIVRNINKINKALDEVFKAEFPEKADELISIAN